MALSTQLSILIIVLTSLTSLATILGNSLIIVAFIIEKRLQNLSNYFITSLAITDLLIGFISMNIFAVYISYEIWPFGRLFCKIWLIFDYSVCLTSQYTVLLITIDRYCLVRIPAKYRTWRTRRKVLILILISWLVPIVVFITVIEIYNEQYYLTIGLAQCFAKFTVNPIFNTLFTVGYYWNTLLVMCFLYIGIYKVARRLQKNSDFKRKRLTSLMATAGQTMSKIGVGLTLNNFDTKNEEFSSQIDNNNLNNNIPNDNNLKSQRFLNITQTTYMNHNLLSTSDLSVKNRSSDTNNNLCTESNVSSSIFEQDNYYLHKSQSETFLCRQGKNSLISCLDFIKYIDEEDDDDNENDKVSRFDRKICHINYLSINNHGNANYLDLNSKSSVPQIKLNSRNATKYKSWDNSLSKSAQRAMKFLKTVHTNNFRNKTDVTQQNRAKKSLRTISFILGAFIICWSPYHVLIIVKGLCDDYRNSRSCINDVLYYFSYWLCYMNSPINPFCYAMANAQFKTTLIKILRGRYLRN